MKVQGLSKCLTHILLIAPKLSLPCLHHSPTGYRQPLPTTTEGKHKLLKRGQLDILRGEQFCRGQRENMKGNISSFHFDEGTASLMMGQAKVEAGWTS